MAESKSFEIGSVFRQFYYVSDEKNGFMIIIDCNKSTNYPNQLIYSILMIGRNKMWIRAFPEIHLRDEIEYKGWELI